MVLGAVGLFWNDRAFHKRRIWNHSLKSHIAEVMSSFSHYTRTGQLLGNIIKMIAATSESTSVPFTDCRYSNRDFATVISYSEYSAIQQSSPLMRNHTISHEAHAVARTGY